MQVYPIISWFQKCVAASRSLNKCICCLYLVCCACWISFFSPFKPFFWSPLQPQPAAALAHLEGIRLEHSKRPTTHTSNGPFHFLSIQGYGRNNPGRGVGRPLIVFCRAFFYNNNNNNNNNNNKNNNNNNPSETRKYWVDVQWGIVSSHGERDPL